MTDRRIKTTGARLGQALEDFVADEEARDPAFGDARALVAPTAAIANAVTLGRMRLRLTQAELAERLGTSNTAISRIESGRHLPSLETLRRLSAVLGVEFVVGPVTVETKPLGAPGKTPR